MFSMPLKLKGSRKTSSSLEKMYRIVDKKNRMLINNQVTNLNKIILLN